MSNKRGGRGKKPSTDEFRFDDADFLKDVDTSKPWERMVSNDEGDSNWNPAYMEYLRNLDEHMEAKCGKKEEGDPTYEAFLSNLQPHKNAYKIHIPEEEGGPKTIYYEQEDSMDEGSSRASSRNARIVDSGSVGSSRKKKGLRGSHPESQGSHT